MQITDIRIKTLTDEGQLGSLEVIMHADEVKSGFLCAQLLTKDGREEDRIFPIPIEAEMDFCMQAQQVHFWNAESGYLYDLVLELRDENMQLLGTTVKRIAFRRCGYEDGRYIVNGKEVRLRVKYVPQEEWKTLKRPEKKDCEKALRELLSGAKRQNYNALEIDFGNENEWEMRLLQELCLEYGLYYLDEGMTCGQKWQESKAEPLSNPDFEMSVTNEGVLIENHCLFTNASEYELHYEIETLCEGSLTADVPPGSGRYVDLPFETPREAGNYRYRVSLCLKEDTVWAKKGFEIAAAESMIANLFFGAGNEEV